ncbi:MAG: ATP-dependent DNA helicase RecG [Bacteroidales bacterium]|jgi:ATP-dependent DNA helicase RecG|nr:ATP-dependent DNA helicase RecG [Bacteroidales bacterium]
MLDTSIEYLKGVGPQRASLLKKELEIFCFGDLLMHYPFRYVDRTRIFSVNELNEDIPFIQLRLKIARIEHIGAGRSARMVAHCFDDTGEMDLVWFQGIKWVKDKLKPGLEYLVFGKPTKYGRRYNIAHAEIELYTEEIFSRAGGLQPIYSTTEKLKSKGLDSKGISRLMQSLFDALKGNIPETLPLSTLKQNHLMDRRNALTQIHFPDAPDKAKYAETRIKFEELFYLQMQLLRFKYRRKTMVKGHVFGLVGDLFNTFYHKILPFSLTEAQKRVIREIRADMGSGKQMNRLLQGDVGSGKTIVALMCMLLAIDNSYQACLMAPTEILANQHYKSFLKYSEGLDLNVELLTGNTKTAQRKVLFESLRNGDIHFLIGTHALIEDQVQFGNLGLVVIDEQHRFGVEQRSLMWQKNERVPHILVMTATPIPRTLAMTIYGDLDVSVIDELPPGRKPVKTMHFFDNSRLKVFAFMHEQIRQGRQIYVVYPLIHESETLDLKDLMDGYESISRDFPLPHYAISIVHGQMKSADKEYEMQRFIKGETQLMVSTTVIEVGVDVPNASVMVIENAERFGLSQLHQLRGRVGRGADQSFCILMTGNKLSAEGKVRIRTMVETNDGFAIAEADLKLRGPGDVQGTRQSGLEGLKLADITRDEAIVRMARQSVEDILDGDPNLAMPEHQMIPWQLKNLSKGNSGLGMIS